MIWICIVSCAIIMFITRQYLMSTPSNSADDISQCIRLSYSEYSMSIHHRYTGVRSGNRPSGSDFPSSLLCHMYKCTRISQKTFWHSPVQDFSWSHYKTSPYKTQ